MSNDADTTLAAFAKESRYPGIFATDADLAIGKSYSSTRGTTELRNLFVIGKDGRIAHRMIPFGVLSQDAYLELEQAVDRAAGVSSPR